MHVFMAVATDLTRGTGETVSEYNQRLQEELATMDIKHWKLLKSTLVSLAVLAFGAFAFVQGADPTVTFVFTVSVAALVYGVEMKELSAIGGLASLKTIQIQLGHSDDQDDVDDDDGGGPGTQSRFGER